MECGADVVLRGSTVQRRRGCVVITMNVVVVMEFLRCYNFIVLGAGRL